jgi:hypothetical protein
MKINARMPQILSIIGKYYYFPVNTVNLFGGKSIEERFLRKNRKLPMKIFTGGFTGGFTAKSNKLKKKEEEGRKEGEGDFRSQILPSYIAGGGAGQGGMASPILRVSDFFFCGLKQNHSSAPLGGKAGHPSRKLSGGIAK